SRLNCRDDRGRLRGRACATARSSLENRPRHSFYLNMTINSSCREGTAQMNAPPESLVCRPDWKTWILRVAVCAAGPILWTVTATAFGTAASLKRCECGILRTI